MIKLVLLLTCAVAQELDLAGVTDTGQWDEVVELLQHIQDTENVEGVEPMTFPYAANLPPAVCYDDLGQMTQLYRFRSPEWVLLGVPVYGTVVDALRVQQDPNVQNLDPTRVLPCGVMGDALRPEPEQSILADLAE